MKTARINEPTKVSTSPTSPRSPRINELTKVSTSSPRSPRINEPKVSTSPTSPRSPRNKSTKVPTSPTSPRSPRNEPTKVSTSPTSPRSSRINKPTKVSSPTSRSPRNEPTKVPSPPKSPRKNTITRPACLPKTKQYYREVCIAEYPNYFENIHKLRRISEISDMCEIQQLKEFFTKLQIDYLTMCNEGVKVDINLYRAPHVIVNAELKLLDDKIKELSDTQFQKIISLDKNELVNGYPIDRYASLKIPYHIYLELVEVWQDKTELSFKEFNTIFYEICSDRWDHIDTFGNYYAGFWEFPEDSAEYSNPYISISQQNCKALFKLPYPKYFILHTIRIGRIMGLESVLFSNYLGIWIKKKINA